MEDKMALFKKDLEHLINKYSLENGSNTPDFLLAEYLVDCLYAYNTSVMKRETWYGRIPRLEKETVEWNKNGSNNEFHRDIFS